MDWKKNKQIHSTRITNWWKLVPKTDKTTENEVFWTHKTPWKFGEENQGSVYNRKEEEGTAKKEMGSGYHRRFCKWMHRLLMVEWSSEALSWEQRPTEWMNIYIYTNLISLNRTASNMPRTPLRLFKVARESILGKPLKTNGPDVNFFIESTTSGKYSWPLVYYTKILFSSKNLQHTNPFNE
jgi:hypothetical protein